MQVEELSINTVIESERYFFAITESFAFRRNEAFFWLQPAEYRHFRNSTHRRYTLLGILAAQVPSNRAEQSFRLQKLF